MVVATNQSINQIVVEIFFLLLRIYSFIHSFNTIPPILIDQTHLFFWENVKKKKKIKSKKEGKGKIFEKKRIIISNKFENDFFLSLQKIKRGFLMFDVVIFSLHS